MSWRKVVALLALGTVQWAEAVEQKTTFYGYINTYFEKAQDQAKLDGAGAGTARADSENNIEYDVRDIHFVMQSSMDRFKTFLNLKAPGAEGVEVSNGWVESQLLGDHLSFRLGKFYRPFEIYNEILDAVPTYIGIEPPELFDNDHLMLTRTTNMMLHGLTGAGPGIVRYSVTTGNDERDGNSELPIGLDVRYIQDVKFLFGASYYTTGGSAKPTTSYVNGGADGSIAPEGGVLPWMDNDTYEVFGGFAQYQDHNIVVQASYFQSPHKGTRNAGAVADMCTNAPLNTRQQEQFGCAGTNNLDADYTVTAWYTRLGYNINSETLGTFTPYVQYDSYKNEETVQNKAFGGDNEAGQSDDGEIAKYTAGLVYRPMPPVAVKADYSLHKQDVMGKDGSYGEARFSFSYYWRM
jgi:hypothetical protein